MKFNQKEILRIETLTKFFAGFIKKDHALEVLKVKERQFLRLVSKYKSKGVLGLAHGSSGRLPWNKISEEKEKELIDTIKKKYPDFNMTHVREKLMEENIQCPSYSTLRRFCHKHNIVKAPKRRSSQVRKLRERYPRKGLFLQIDGSYHTWFGRQGSCLIAVVDDATGDILSARFCKAETTHDCMMVIKQIIREFGIFGIMYSDKAGVFNTRKRVDFNQLIRALKELGISSILANSPEAKGRVERLFRTLQDRLIPEMRIRGIANMDQANSFLKGFIPKYNAKFGVLPADPEDYFRPVSGNINLNEIFCVKFTRKIVNGHRFSHKGQQYLITNDLEYSLVGRKIEIREYHDRSLGFFCNGLNLKVKKSFEYLKALVA